jgi:surface antigen
MSHALHAWELNVLSKLKLPLTVASVILALGVSSSLALAGVSTSNQVDTGPQAANQFSERVDQDWHGNGYGYGYGPYRGPYRPPVVYRAPPPVIVVPAPVVVYPAPVYPAPIYPAPGYPAPVYVAPAPMLAPAPVANQIVCRGSNNGAILGGAIGGVTGAVVGANASHHHPWEAATGGSILGILLGSAVGHAIDAGDQYCTTQAIVAAPIGRPVYWVNPATGMQYQIAPTRQYQQWGTTCRDYQASAVINGQWQMIHGTACLQPDGSWQTVSG